LKGGRKREKRMKGALTKKKKKKKEVVNVKKIDAKKSEPCARRPLIGKKHKTLVRKKHRKRSLSTKTGDLLEGDPCFRNYTRFEGPKLKERGFCTHCAKMVASTEGLHKGVQGGPGSNRQKGKMGGQSIDRPQLD